jgi:N-acetyl-anhydromuramyl-L-alanine amidase AmpD
MNYYDTTLPEYKVVENLLPNETTNYRDRKSGSTIKAVVVHWTAAPNQKAVNTRQHFVESEYVSSNYILGPCGEVLRVVPDDKTAYANGGTYLGKPTYTDLVYEQFVSENGYLRHNDFTLSIETNPIDSDGNFSNETYTALVRLTADLLIANNLTTTDGLYQHHDFTTKDCPKIFVNEGESYRYYINDEGQTRAVTPTSNQMWEQFKSDVRRAMNR